MTPPSGTSSSVPAPAPKGGMPKTPPGAGGGFGAGGPPQDRAMPLMEHLLELRQRLLYAFAAFVVVFLGAFFVASDIFTFLAQPMVDTGILGENPTVIYTAIEEKFFVNIRISFFTALFVTFPMIATQIWLFVAPGLYENEKGAFRPFLVATPIMFILGGSFAYYLAIPVAWEFFASFQQAPAEGAVAVELVPRAREYLATTMVIIMAFGIAFLLPVLLVLLIKAGLLSSAFLARNRRYSILIAVVAAALLTPPDPVSQVGLAVPMLLLYEVSIHIGRQIERRRGQSDEEEEEDDGDDDF